MRGKTVGTVEPVYNEHGYNENSLIRTYNEHYLLWARENDIAYSEQRS